MVRLARHTRRIVGQDQVIPPEMGEQSIAGGEVDPYRPFFRIDTALPLDGCRFDRIHLLFSLNAVTPG